MSRPLFDQIDKIKEEIIEESSDYIKVYILLPKRT